ncbi:DAZ-associated protein 2 isoform X1 [Parasteatoda tepidariorum]|uniref:DAZ-associated protein 2 n=1 Tax=Parasteatoda tepidariorum TaxID=114398 RepID=A0A2L2XZT3_PARTP|nr:DAZ-associated protein 2 isoform X1 [Parasteatoda tepidariorum]
MSSDKKEYPVVGGSAPTAPAYISVPSAGTHQVTMTSPYPGYPPPAYSSPAYLPSSAPTYLPATYAAAPLQPHLPYGTVSVAPNITAFGVQPTYLPQLTQVYSPRPGTVYVPAAAAYDASARFDGHSMPVVPPPPPGVAPNAAQLAMMQGNPVVLSQQKNSFLTGGSGAGYTFW